jgi:leucyl aminopeptidase (aminopeptidase T)
MSGYCDEREKNLIASIEKLYSVNLGVNNRERVLVFTDSLSSDEVVSGPERKRRDELLNLAEKVAKTGKNFCEVVFYTYPSLKNHGVEPPEQLWESAFGSKTCQVLRNEGCLDRILRKENSQELVDRSEKIVENFKKDAVDNVIALSNYSTSHTRFRDLMTHCAKAKYASMPLFDENMFHGPMQVDWSQLARRTEAIAESLREAEEVIITAPNGTDLKIVTKDREVMADTGILTVPGSFGNLPAGEVFLAPVEGMTDGVFVLEWAPTHKLKSGVTLIIKEGRVEEIYGEDPYADELREVLGRDDDFGNIAELGIGTNDKAKRPDNILESEKILGTVHVALGDNSSFGGTVRTAFHTDYILFKPTLELLSVKGGKNRLLDDGDLLLDLSL